MAKTSISVKKASGTYEGSLLKTGIRKNSPEKKIVKVEISYKEIKEPDTPQNDWWGKEYTIETAEIHFEDGTSLRISGT